MEVLKTPDDRFDGLKDYAFAAHYHVVTAGDGTELRMHYLDEGPRDAPTLLCMHGEPSWSYLYRKMIPLLTAAGYLVIAPDLVGFGKSDKPSEMDDYTYSAHVDWLNQWLRGLDLTGLTLVCQDWGGLIGLRVFGDNPDRFDRLVIANTGLPGTSMLTDDVSAMMAQMFAMVPVPDAAMVGEQFRPGLTANLQLGHQQPVTQPIHLGLPVLVEPLQSRMQAWTVGLKANRCLQRCAQLPTAAAVFQHFVD